jgi:hypothetical protein
MVLNSATWLATVMGNLQAEIEKRGTVRLREHVMRKVLRGHAKDKDGDLILIVLLGAIPVPHVNVPKRPDVPAESVW